MKECPRVMLVENDAEEDSANKYMSGFSRFTSLLAKDFPELNWTMPSAIIKHAYVYAPLMGKGGNSLYHILGKLYRACLDLPEPARAGDEDEKAVPIKAISVVDFCLLCFHISGEYLMTSNTALQMWVEPLKINSITTLMGETDSLSEVISFLENI